MMTVVGVLVGPRAWQWWDSRRTFAPETPLAQQCDHVPDGARRAVLRAEDGTALGAALVGDPASPLAVVLRQGASQTLCDWLPWASETAAATGAQVLLFDRRGRGSSPAAAGLAHEAEDLAGAVAGLRADGVEEVVLVASSMGNSVMFSALALLTEPPCAIAAISPVLVSRDGSGTVDGSDPGPLPPTWVTWETRNDVVSGNAATLVARAGLPSPVHPLPVDTEDHSRQLVANHPRAAEFVLEAVLSCADR
ncbi:alpha/beta hydrolase [Nocardioides sp. 616]|uniref:alpha/beta hydrolase n=1 Tax=Nocardioides sp. 616 TaxID=2268090 RepID=UPI0013B4612B|nr:alpha/beta hydrolase [Nocardioides sp. 616]